MVDRHEYEVRLPSVDQNLAEEYRPLPIYLPMARLAYNIRTSIGGRLAAAEHARRSTRCII